MIKKRLDSLVVGAGILGISHAYYLNKMGHTVALVEKNKMPSSASVRNFGQIVPSGFDQKWQNYGRESLRVYKEIHGEMDIGIRKEGTVYLAQYPEEVQLIEELAEINRGCGYHSELLTANECESRFSQLRKGSVQAGLYFPEEINLDPRCTIPKLIQYLQAQGVHFIPNTTIRHLRQKEEFVIAETENLPITASHAFVCSGSDCHLLYPDLLAEAPIDLVKLQLQLTVPQEGKRLPGAILTGSSIRRYESFKECPSYPFVMNEGTFRPFFDEHSIHILLKQRQDGRIMIGDSHHYAPIGCADELGFETRHDVNKRIFDEVKALFALSEPKIEQSWLGYYTQMRNGEVFQKSISDRIFLLTAVGGKGMTASFGLSKKHIKKVLKNSFAL